MKTILFIIMVLCPITVFAQKGYNDKINRTDSNGLKQGYWIEELSYGRREPYYKNGVEDGVYKGYFKAGTLRALGEFKNGNYAGVWYFFTPIGQVDMILKDFASNKQLITYQSGLKSVPKFRCYFTAYHPNGAIEEEGLLLWDEDPLLDTSYEFGLWKYYDDKGNLTKSETYK